VQRKVFRVELMQMAGRAGAAGQHKFTDELLGTRAKQSDDDESSAISDMKRDLASLRDTIARNKRDLASIIGDGKERRMARAGDELRAAVDGMDYATQNILKSAEVIDESARALAASLSDDYARGLAQDIQDNVVKVYEACNFQDITGQRISNVIGTMTMVEDQVAAMITRCDNASAETPKPAKFSRHHELLNGPKLDGDAGHASQRDVDEMFA
jgi:chemotaxis protein CheZ